MVLYLELTEEEKAEYSDYNSEDEQSREENYTHNSDSDEECFCEKCGYKRLTEYDIDPAFFPSNSYYQRLGIDFIIDRNNYLPDPMMFSLYEKLAEQIPTPSEDWKRQKNT